MSDFIELLRHEGHSHVEADKIRSAFRAAVREIVREEIAAQKNKEGAGSSDARTADVPVEAGPAPSPSKPTHVRVVDNVYGLDILTEGKVYPVVEWKDDKPRFVADDGRFVVLTYSKWEPAEPDAPWQPRVGERVRFRDKCGTGLQDFPWGHTGVVARVTPTGWPEGPQCVVRVLWDDEGAWESPSGWDPHWLRPIAPTPAQEPHALYTDEARDALRRVLPAAGYETPAQEYAPKGFPPFTPELQELSDACIAEVAAKRQAAQEPPAEADDGLEGVIGDWCADTVPNAVTADDMRVLATAVRAWLGARKVSGAEVLAACDAVPDMDMTRARLMLEAARKALAGNREHADKRGAREIDGAASVA